MVRRFFNAWRVSRKQNYPILWIFGLAVPFPLLRVSVVASSKRMQIYLIQNGQQAGPFSVEVIRVMLSTGHIAITDQGWHEGLTAWQSLSTFLPIPEPPPVAPPPIPPPPVSHTPPPAVDTSGTNEQSFGSWYATKFGKMSGVKQALAWIFYGFLWIPVWWLISTQSHTSAAENSSESGGHISNQASSTNPAAMPTASKNRYSKPVLIGCFVAFGVLAAIIGAQNQRASENSHRKEAPPPSQPQPTQTQYPQLDSTSVTRSSPCRFCQGTGQRLEQCSRCRGNGTIMTGRDSKWDPRNPPMQIPCPQCRGGGQMPVRCSSCRGTGAD